MQFGRGIFTLWEFQLISVELVLPSSDILHSRRRTGQSIFCNEKWMILIRTRAVEREILTSFSRRFYYTSPDTKEINISAIFHNLVTNYRKKSGYVARACAAVQPPNDVQRGSFAAVPPAPLRGFLRYARLIIHDDVDANFHDTYIYI